MCLTMFNKYSSLLCATVDYTEATATSEYVVELSEYDMRSPESLGRAALHVLDLNIQMRCTRIDLLRTACDDALPKGHWLRKLKGTSFIVENGVITKYVQPKP